MYATLTDQHLDAILRAGIPAPKEGSRRTLCPECSRNRMKAEKPCVSLFPSETEIQWRCRNCGRRGKALLRA